MQVKIAGQDIGISGDVEDLYFQNAQQSVDGFDPLLYVARTMPEGATILDVGANIGLSTIALALTVPASRIISFEPSPVNFFYLEQNVEVLNGRDVDIRRLAVSDKPGMLHFHAAKTGGWSHVVGDNHMSRGIESVDVEAIRLDDLVGVRPDLIKIDVEGHEPEVLAGAKKLIEECRPVIFMEFNLWPLNAYAGHSPAAFATALFENFDIQYWRNAGDFLNHVIGNGGITDIVLRLKEGGVVPPLEEMSFPPKARVALAELRGARA